MTRTLRAAKLREASSCSRARLHESSVSGRTVSAKRREFPQSEGPSEERRADGKGREDVQGRAEAVSADDRAYAGAGGRRADEARRDEDALRGAALVRRRLVDDGREETRLDEPAKK